MNLKKRFAQLWVKYFSNEGKKDAIEVQKALELYIEALTRIESDPNESENVIDEATALKRLYQRYKGWHKCFLKARDELDGNKNGNIEESKAGKKILKLKAFIKDSIHKKHPDLYVRVECRLKAVSSFDEKIWRDDSLPTKAIIKLKDMIGFRIIIDDSSIESRVIDCYYVAETIKYALEEIKIKQVYAGAVKQVSENKNRNSNEMVYIPSAEEIPTHLKFLELAKDYIINPKDNEYQGLHLIFSNPEEEDFYEIQVKTMSMFDFSENHAAAHYIYKLLTATQTDDEKKDLRLFNGLKGFRSLDGEHYIDFSGFLTPLSV